MPAGSLLWPSDPPDARLHALSTSGISLQLPSFGLKLRRLKYLLLAPKDDFLRHGKDSVAFFFYLAILSLPLKTFFPTLSEVFSLSVSTDPSKSLARMGSDCQVPLRAP